MGINEDMSMLEGMDWVEETSTPVPVWEPKTIDDKLVGVVMYRDDRDPNNSVFVIGTGTDGSDFYSIPTSKIDLDSHFGLQVTIDGQYKITLDAEGERALTEFRNVELEMFLRSSKE